MSAAHDARLPPAVQGVVPRGETCWLCDHPRALPVAGSAPADWVVLPLAFAWLYPDSMLLLESLTFARRGLLLHGKTAGDALPRLRRLCVELRLQPTLLDESGRALEFEGAPADLREVRLVVRAVRTD